MEHIAYYFKHFSITRHGLIMAFAIAAAIMLSFMLCRINGTPRLAVLASAALSFFVSPLLSQVMYWYSCSEQYSSIAEAIFGFSKGGQSLLGAMLGVLIAVLAVRCLKITDNALQLLDVIAPSGALAIAVGRLSSVYTADDYGKMTFDKPTMQRFPISMPVAENGTDAVVWRFPTFLYESIAAAVIFVILMIMLFERCSEKHEQAYERNRGSVFMMFLIMYSAMQVVLESTRYDALFFRSNGFVSVSQMFGAVGIVAAYVFFARRTGKQRGKLPVGCIVLYVLTFLMFGVVGLMEYLVQRHGNMYYIYYPVMLAAMLIVCYAGFKLCEISEGKNVFMKPKAKTENAEQTAQ